MAGAAVLAFAISLALLEGGRARAGHALLIGHGIGQVLALSWLLPTLWSFDKDAQTVLRATLGLSPFRLVFAAVAVCGAAYAFPVLPLVLSFLATHLWGHVVEHFVLGELTRRAV